MGGVRVFIAAICLAGPLWLAATMPAHACSCAQRTTAERVATTDVIVIGTPHDLRVVGDIPTPEYTPAPGEAPALPVIDVDIEWTVDVEEYLKGSGPRQIVAGSSGFLMQVPSGPIEVRPGTTPMCGFAPEEGVQYLFFLYRGYGREFATGSCAFNAPISGTEPGASVLLDEIRTILAGPPVDALPDTGAGPPRDVSPVRTLAFAGIGVALAAVALFSPVVLRRREP